MRPFESHCRYFPFFNFIGFFGQNELKRKAILIEFYLTLNNPFDLSVQFRGVRVNSHNQISGHDASVPSSTSFDLEQMSSKCVDTNSLIAGSVVFLVAQVLLLVIWILFWKKKRSHQVRTVDEI